MTDQIFSILHECRTLGVDLSDTMWADTDTAQAYAAQQVQSEIDEKENWLAEHVVGQSTMLTVPFSPVPPPAATCSENAPPPPSRLHPPIVNGVAAVWDVAHQAWMVPTHLLQPDHSQSRNAAGKRRAEAEPPATYDHGDHNSNWARHVPTDDAMELAMQLSLNDF